MTIQFTETVKIENDRNNFNILSLRYLCDSQVEMSIRQLEVQTYSSEEKSGLQMLAACLFRETKLN